MDLGQRRVHSFVPRAIRIAVVMTILVGWLARPVHSAGQVDLSFGVPLKRPLLVELNTQIDGYIGIEATGFSWGDDYVFERELVFVDEHYELGKNKEKALRQFILDKSTYNGEVSDTALNGVKALYNYDSEEKQWEVELADDRALTGELFDTLLDQTRSLGLWLHFPKSSGGKIEVDLAPLASIFLGAESDVDAKGKFRLTSHDPIKKTATLQGKADFKAAQQIADTSVKVQSKGDLTIEIDVAKRYIASIDYQGRLTFSSKGSAQVTGDASHKVELEATVDSKQVEKMRRKKPKFRTKKIRAEKLGVGFKLPSHWTRVRDDSAGRVFIRTLDYDKGEATIDLTLIDEDSSYQPGLFLDRVYAYLKETYPNMVYKKTKNPLGREEGRVYYVPTSRDMEDGQFIQVEIYPYRGKYIQFRLYADPSAYRAAYKEFMKAKRSMGQLAPKRTR